MSETIKNFPKQSRVLGFNSGAAQKFLERFQTPSGCQMNNINRSVDFLRWGLGFIYLWFGALKFFPALSSAEAIAGMTIEILTFGYVTPSISHPALAL